MKIRPKKNSILLNEDDLDLIKKNVAKGYIEIAITKIKDNSSKTNKFVYQQILSIESRWNQIKSQENKGIRGQDDIQVEKNKVIDSILNLRLPV